MSAGLADALDAVAAIALALAADIRPATGANPVLHPGRTAELRVGDTVVGVAGELLPSLARELDLPGVVAVAELDLDALLALGATQIAARPIGTLPAATQDVSLVVAADIPAGAIRDAVAEGAGELLEDAAARRRLPGERGARGVEVAHLRAAVPCRRPHPDGGRGDRGETRRRRARGFPSRSNPPRIANPRVE